MSVGILSEVRWHSDSGHAWLEVPLASCRGLDVSAYSYKDTSRGVAYLEEDCDAGAWVRHQGLTFAEFRETYVPTEVWPGDCFVRSLTRFRGAWS
jgi:hypothetical protein